ncbi:MAG TPA: FGGY family carbohydrate kinase [Dictyobacter sp.]|nr:FGGY family carbohydrate kinase [Dictyobacter sp.]
MSDVKAPYILALDVGTSSTRALLFDAQGRTVPKVGSQHKYELQTSAEGEVTVNADMLVDLVAQTIDETLQAAGSRRSEIKAVAFDTFWHSLLGVDKNGHAVTPVITWEDTRPYKAALELRKELDEKKFHDRTGVRFHASYWPAKLRWLKQHQADVFAQAAQWISFGEYLHRQFLGRSVCSLSMASGTGLLVGDTRSWDTDLIKVLGIQKEQLSEIGDVQDGIKGLQPEYASRWKELHDIPWYPAIGDGAAACIGSGCVNEKNWSVTMGTSSAVRVVIDPERATPSMGLWKYFVDGKRAVIGGAMSEGGNLFGWFQEQLKLSGSLQDIEPALAQIEPDSHGLTILPFIAGERSLGWHADVRMTISGVNIHTTSYDLVRAGAEALSYRIKNVYENLRDVLQVDASSHKVMTSGGALAASALLRGIIADALGVPIYPSTETEASARGVALLALEALGVIDDLEKVAPDLLEPSRPAKKNGEIYRQAATRQSELYQRLLGDK